MSVSMLRVTRLDFQSTIDVMLSLCDALLGKVPPAKKKGVEDVIFCLNTAAKAIESYDLAETLTPPRDWRPKQAASEDNAIPAAVNLLPLAVTNVLACLRTQPGTAEELAAAAGCAPGSVAQHIFTLRKAGHHITNKRDGRDKPGRYFLENAQSNGHAPNSA